MNKSTKILILAIFFIFDFNRIHLCAQTPASSLDFGGVEFTSSNLPIIKIETNGQQIKDLYRITAQMQIIYNGEGIRNNPNASPNNYDGRIAIELRGSASISHPKKGYRFETQDSLGNNLNVSLIGMPKENDWILYGPYDDQSLIRNELAYKLSNDIGRYASRTRFCELVLNNEYQGLYVLMEKIKRDKNRINISELDSLATSGDGVTGGYIIKFDKVEGENIGGWWSSWEIFYQYHYPQSDEIKSEQKTYIQNFMDKFENAMTRPDFADSSYGYPNYIDVESFVDFFILCEFCKNIDAYRISNFMYKDRDSKGGKLHEGPIWDFNLSFGKTWYPEDTYRVDEWEIDHNLYKPTDSPKVPFWWERLGHDADFARRVEIRWRELRNSVLSLDYVYQTIDQLVDTLAEARQRNFERWTEVVKYHSYEIEIQMMKEWISDRVDWIEENLGTLSAIRRPTTSASIPASCALEQNFPNPFNSATMIKYQLAEPSKVILTIFNLAGQQIIQLIDETQDAGTFQLLWDGNDQARIPVASGIYLLQIQTDNFLMAKKLLLIR